MDIGDCAESSELRSSDYNPRKEPYLSSALRLTKVVLFFPPRIIKETVNDV